MVDKNLTFKISADDGDAVKAFKNVAGAAKRELGTAQEEQDETVSSGKRMASALSSVADQIAEDLAKLDSASAKLGDALGPELAAKADRGVEGIVQDLRRAGLTFEEIEADVDDLAAAIKKLDDIEVGHRAKRGIDDLNTSVKKVEASTDKTRSVMANFAGNAAQEIPGIGQALGPVNVAIGQFAEYAAEGDIAMGNLVKAIAPMAVAAGGLMAANHLMGQWKAATEAAGEAVDSLTDRIREGQRGIRALRDEWQETGAVQAAVAKLFGSGAKDVTADLVKAGLNADSAMRIIEGGLPAAREWRDQVVQMGTDSGDAYRAFLLLAQQINFVEQAEKAAAINAAFFRGELVYTQDELKATAEWVEGMSTTYTTMSEDAAKAAEQVRMLNDELAKVPDSVIVKLGVDMGAGLNAGFGRQIAEALNKYQRIGGDGGPR